MRPCRRLCRRSAAQAHYNAGDPAGALALWKAAAGRVPAAPEAFFSAAILLRELGPAGWVDAGRRPLTHS